MTRLHHQPTASVAGGRAETSRRGFLAFSAAAVAAAALPAAPVAAPEASAPLPPLTLADLKVRSERALAILQRHFPDRIWGDVFPAEEGEGYHGLKITCDCPDVRPDWGCLRCSTALPDTPMIGAMSGYYEPEWSETTAYGLLADVLEWSDKPQSMTDAEWIEALAVARMTPASHAARQAEFERQIAEMDWAGDADLIAADAAIQAPPAPERDGPDDRGDAS